MRHNNSGRQITINSELKKVILELIAKNTDIDQDRMVDLIVTEKTLRLPKDIVKSGVEAYFSPRTIASKQQEDKVRSMIDIDAY